MGRWGRVRAATLVAVASFVCCVCVSRSPARADDAGDEIARVMLFSGRDIWLNGVFLYGGFLWSPRGLDEAGFTVKILSSGGLYRYRSGALGGARVIGVESTTQILPGWRFKRGHLEAKVFIGLDFEKHWLWPDDTANRLRGRAFGLRLAAEVWAEPSAETMLAADISLASIGLNYSARVAAGWHALDQFYAGPELQVYGGDGYRQLRIGLHLTSLKTETTEWSAAGGWAMSSDEYSGPYLRLGFLQRL
ncbi:MAG TPA: cellulose biosynthesis protein BcsS [Pseudolabrys sp.]|nr:cellulose biosynthesis protein BcsS [Pseudolabrys sp.]